MKYLMTFALAGAFYLSTATASVDLEDTLAWEQAAETYLNVADLEIYNLVVEGEKVTFEYDKEFFNPFVIVTYECVGTSEEGQKSFKTLSCIEEEPTLWDEL